MLTLNAFVLQDEHGPWEAKVRMLQPGFQDCFSRDPRVTGLVASLGLLGGGRNTGGATARSLGTRALKGTGGLQLHCFLSLSSPGHKAGAFAVPQVCALISCFITCPKVPGPTNHGLQVPELSDQIDPSCLQVDCFRYFDIVMERKPIGRLFSSPYFCKCRGDLCPQSHTTPRWPSYGLNSF